MTAPPPATPARSGDAEILPIDRGWEVACAPPGEPPDLDSLDWRDARVPGTVAGALGRDAAAARNLDDDDWWFRTRFDSAPAEPGEEVVLHLGGIATVAEVRLNGELVLESESMFAAHDLDVGAILRGDNELTIRCRALTPLLKPRRKPRARWRTRVVAEGNLRWYRTMILGRAPGFAPGPAAVGPWRPVAIERRLGVLPGTPYLRTHLDGDDGVLSVSVPLAGVAGASIELDGPSGTHRAALEHEPGDGSIASCELRIPQVERWWPHTHGEPALHSVRILWDDGSGERSRDVGRVGFRSIAPGPTPDHAVLADGLDLHVNGRRVFARGAVWTPVDALGLAPSDAELRAALEQARDAGMNMIRVPGLGAYESPAFHDLCDELGLMLWQDLMFANLDYPIDDPELRATVTSEAQQVLGEIAAHPSLVVLCGNSEIEQQVAMLGLDPELGRGELFGELLPAMAKASGADAIYVPSAPSGGERPFRPDRGVANYFGVGGYRRPIEDVRRAGVRFASECLAFANVPVESTLEKIIPGAPSQLVAHHPAWKAAVPRDAGTGWDFEDVRDHYLQLLFDVDPVELRAIDHDRYLELSRAVSGEVMAEVFGEWRRAGSPCGGGLILWLRDLMPGAGWGVVDSEGEPKVAYHHLRRALAPVAVWTTDEGMNGIGVHVANDRPEPLTVRLRIALYRGEQRVDEVSEELEIGAGEVLERDLEAILGRFVDASWAYRFGPPAQDLIVASLERPDADCGDPISQSFRFPAGRPTGTASAADLGLEATLATDQDGSALVTVSSRSLAYGVRLHAPGIAADDDAFSIEPGGRRLIRLRPMEPGSAPTGVTLSALNLEGTIRATAAAEA